MELQDIEEKCSEFQEKVLRLRSGDYYGEIEGIKKDLGLDGYSHAEIEALLIYEIEKFEFNNSIKADAALMEIGLLRGFSISEEIRGSAIAASTKTDVTKRREDFLLASDYVEHYHPKKCYSHKDLEDNARLKEAAKTLGTTDRANLISVAEKIESMSVEKIKEHIALSIKERPSPEKRYIPEELLPELQHPRKDHSIELKKPKKPKPGTVDSYLQTIQVSDKYDDVSEGLYYKLCRPKADPPYDEWVATWLIKCINEKFSETLDADILHVSFALLPEYELAGTSVEERLEQYLNNSIYPALASHGKYRDIDDIEDDEQIEEIKEELRKSERQRLHELVRYVNQLGEPVEHINNLDKYGELKEYDGKKIYKPYALKLYNNKSYPIGQIVVNFFLNDEQKYSVDIDTISSKYEVCKFWGKFWEKIKYSILSLIIFCIFLANWSSKSVTTFDSNVYSNLDGVPSRMDYVDSVIGHNSTLPVDSEETYLEHLAMNNLED